MNLSDEELDDTNINSIDTSTSTNPYNNYLRDRMLQYASEIKYVKDRYTTPVTVELSSTLKSGDNTITITATR